MDNETFKDDFMYIYDVSRDRMNINLPLSLHYLFLNVIYSNTDILASWFYAELLLSDCKISVKLYEHDYWVQVTCQYTWAGLIHGQIHFYRKYARCVSSKTFAKIIMQSSSVTLSALKVSNFKSRDAIIYSCINNFHLLTFCYA